MELLYITVPISSILCCSELKELKNSILSKFSMLSLYPALAIFDGKYSNYRENAAENIIIDGKFWHRRFLKVLTTFLI